MSNVEIVLQCIGMFLLLCGCIFLYVLMFAFMWTFERLRAEIRHESTYFSKGNYEGYERYTNTGKLTPYCQEFSNVYGLYDNHFLWFINWVHAFYKLFGIGTYSKEWIGHEIAVVCSQISLERHTSQASYEKKYGKIREDLLEDGQIMYTFNVTEKLMDSNQRHKCCFKYKEGDERWLI